MRKVRPPAPLASSPSPTALEMRGTRDKLRDAVCVGPRYPGSPSIYRYALRESCTPLVPVPKRPTKAAAKPTKLTAEMTRKEIEQIRQVLEVQYREGEPKEEQKKFSPLVLQANFSRMISPHNRLKYPDPEIRYNKILDTYKPRQPPPSRYRIMYLTLTHLEALLLSEESDALPGIGAVLRKVLKQTQKKKSGYIPKIVKTGKAVSPPHPGS